jgi:manganese transport protein
VDASPHSGIEVPPATFWGTLKCIGPGLIITANIVGTGELIMTTKLGAEVGFELLWFILFGCFIKVFVQVEWGRYALSEGATSLQALNTLPGPRLRVSWVVWLWIGMYLGTLFQMSGMVVAIADLFTAPGGSLWTHRLWAVLTVLSVVVLLIVGRYGLVEKGSTLMVVSFTICTVVAVAALQWTTSRMSAGEVASGLVFNVPPGKLLTAFGAFAITGVGAAELMFYPIWCLEKGYARFTGPRDDSIQWAERARGWMRVLRIDAWISMVVYTVATVAFYLLGAAVLNRQGLKVTNKELIPTLERMYTSTFGEWGGWIFGVGAFMVLYSTLFVSTASNARLFADFGSIARIFTFESPERRLRVVRLAIGGIGLLLVAIYFTSGEPVTLVTIGAVAQGIMLPFLAFAAVYFRHVKTAPALRPGATWTFFLWVSSVAMTAVGIYLAGKSLKFWT